MHRRFSILSIPLLAALFAGPLLQARPTGALFGQATVQPPPAWPAAHYSVPQARSQAAIKAKGPLDRQGGSGTPLPAQVAPPILAPQHFTAKLFRDPSSIAGTARHFPLFPTGPPPNR